MDTTVQHHIHPDFLRPQLSTKLYRTTYNYLKRFYSEQLFIEICRELKMPVEFLLADDNWVSVEFGRQFAKLVRLKTNDSEVYRKIGGFFFDEQNINPFEHQLLKTVSPFGFFRIMSRTYKRTNQACELGVQTMGVGRYEVTIQAYEGTMYSDMALNTVGAMEALEQFYNLDGFKIQMLDEIIPGQEISRLRLTLEFNAAQYLLLMARIPVVIAAIGIGIGYLGHLSEQYTSVKLMPFITTAFAAVTFWLTRMHKSLAVFRRNVELYYEKSREKNLQLYQKSEMLDQRYREANLLRELSAELITLKDPQKVLEVCLNSLEEKFTFKQIALFLVSKQRRKLFLSESRGLSDLRTQVDDVEFEFPNPRQKEGFFSAILERGESALILDIENYKSVLQDRNRRLLELLKAKSLAVCPIQTPEEKYGLLVVFGTPQRPPLTQDDQYLIEKVSNFLALYLDNAANFEKEASLRKVFQQYVPPIVLEEFRGSGNALSTEPKRAQIISVFIDLRDFTAMSEKISPERVVQIISRYADFVSSIFSSYDFVIDNIVGDAVVMFHPCGEDPAADLRKLFRAFHDLNERWPELQASMGQLGLKDFKLGAGANFGPALVGNVGGSVKRNYTALGDTVNIASRLQSLSKKYPANLGNGNLTALISKEILEKANFTQAELLSEKLRGRDQLTYFMNLDPETAKALAGILLGMDEAS